MGAVGLREVRRFYSERNRRIIFFDLLLIAQNYLCEQPGVPPGQSQVQPGSATQFPCVHLVGEWLAFSSLDARLSLSFLLLSYLFSGTVSPLLPFYPVNDALKP